MGLHGKRTCGGVASVQQQVEPLEEQSYTFSSLFSFSTEVAGLDLNDQSLSTFLSGWLLLLKRRSWFSG